MIANYLKLSSSLSRIIKYKVSGGFFQNKSPKDSEPSFPIEPPVTSTAQVFKSKEPSKDDRGASTFVTSSEQGVDQLVKKINESNKYFLGVKYNTNYLKVSKVVKYEEISTLKSERVSVNDIPVQISKKGTEDVTFFEKCNQQAALNQKSAKIAFSKSRIQPTIANMTNIIKQFIINLSKKQRFANVEPNFEVQCIKVLNGLSQNVRMNLRNQEAEPEIKIKGVTLFKGLSVYRNDNYSTDSFQKLQDTAEGIINYILYQKGKDSYPQIEWFSTKKIMARFQLLVKGGPVIDVVDSGNLVGSTENVIHTVIIQADLLPPPAISEYQITQQQYLKSYRLQYNSLVLTNFDRKNSFYPLTYSETEKQNNLINRII